MVEVSDIGQHFLIGLQLTSKLTDHDRKLLAELQPSGIVLFAKHFEEDKPYHEWMKSLDILLSEVRSLISRDIIIAIDHEGGTVIRPPQPVTRFPWAYYWGESAKEIGQAMGQELESIGVNLAFAPVVDVLTNKENPVIGRRAFGTTAEIVTRLAAEFMDGLQQSNVCACLKHYPGHGDTFKDSHVELPVLTGDMDYLRKVDLVPFANLHNKTQFIMTGHLHIPKVDNNPSTCSEKLINGYLRKELGYNNLVVTDDIGMKAVSDLFDSDDFLLKTMASGTDLIMVCAHWTDTRRSLYMVKTIIEGMNSGKLDEKHLNASKKRINNNMATIKNNPVTPLDQNVFEQHQKLSTSIEVTDEGRILTSKESDYLA